MKALIVGNDVLGHDELVRLSFVAGGGINADLYNISSFNQAVIDYAKTNDYDAIIYSYSGEEDYFSLANSNPDIMIFMPSDSYNGDLQQLVLTDFTPTTDDYEFCTTYGSSQSNANGYVCGQIFAIASGRNCSLQEARICANITKSQDGIIDVNSAIAYDGEIKLTVGDITVERINNFTLQDNIGRIIDATNYEIRIKDEQKNILQIIQTTSLSNNDNLPNFGIYYLDYRGYNIYFSSDWSNEKVIGYEYLDYYISEDKNFNFKIFIDIYNRLMGEEYIPSYVQRTEDYSDFVKSIAYFISEYANNIQQFSNIYNDEKLLNIFLEKRGMFLTGNENLLELQNIAQNRLKILSRRGTISMLEEIKRLCNENSETNLELLGQGQIGWVVNKTSPMYRNNSNELNYCYINNRKAIVFKLKNQNLTLSNQDLIRILKRYFQPMHIRSLYFFL